MENPVQLAIEATEDHSLLPLCGFDGTANVVEFISHASDTKMKLLHHVYLEAKVQIVDKKTGLKVAADMPYGYLCNGGLTSMIKSATLYFNDTIVANYSDNFGILEFIQTSLNYDIITAEAKLGNQGFFTVSDATKQKELFADSKTIQMLAKINCFNTEKFLIPGVTVRWKFVLQPQNFYLVEQKKTVASVEKTSDSLVKLSDLKLHVRHVTMRSEFLLDLEMRLSKGNLACYESKTAQLLSTTIAASQRSFSTNSLFNGLTPSYALFCIMENAAYNGSTAHDPMIFQSHGITNFNFIVNHKNVPLHPMEIINTAGEESYASAFQGLYDSLGIAFDNNSCCVLKENFLTHGFFLAQDLTKARCGLTTLNEPLESCNLGFSVTFKSTTSKALTALVYLLQQKKVVINGNRDVRVVY